MGGRGGAPGGASAGKGSASASGSAGSAGHADVASAMGPMGERIVAAMQGLPTFHDGYVRVIDLAHKLGDPSWPDLKAALRALVRSGRARESYSLIPTGNTGAAMLRGSPGERFRSDPLIIGDKEQSFFKLI